MNVALFAVLMSATLIAALRFGGAPERWVGCMFATAAALTFLAYTGAAGRFRGIEFYAAIVDVGLLVGLVAILLRADRFWPIAMFAVHGVTVIAHFVKFLNLSIMRQAYAVAVAMPSYAAMLILVVAIVRHRLWLARTGQDVDWSVLSR